MTLFCDRRKETPLPRPQTFRADMDFSRSEVRSRYLTIRVTLCRATFRLSFVTRDPEMTAHC